MGDRLTPAPCKVWCRPGRGCNDILPSLRTAPPSLFKREGGARLPALSPREADRGLRGGDEAVQAAVASLLERLDLNLS